MLETLNGSIAVAFTVGWNHMRYPPLPPPPPDDGPELPDPPAAENCTEASRENWATVARKISTVPPDPPPPVNTHVEYTTTTMRHLVVAIAIATRGKLRSSY